MKLKAGTTLSSPWIKFYREIEALFKEDPEIKIVYDEDEPEVKLYVENTEKAEAIAQLLPAAKAFGNVVLKITIIPANALGESPKASLFRKAFKGNPAFSFIASVEGIFTNPISYVVFKNKVVQFFNDDLSDINGNCSTLYQELAKDVFGETDGIFFCTDTPDNLGKPLGEWP